uniref:G-protein-signaling modulator 1-like n=1 Tax=Sinocyclocheilus rhinocerous TaxID=307959 RepID=A0A673JR07_9TELE
CYFNFPDALCELLFALQEGRRLNDQRCSFRLEVVFSSMTSLQKEEFFDLLVTSQGRRLDDQRAELQNAPSAPPPPLPKAQGRLEEQRSAAPGPMDDEDFFFLLLKVQGGRMDEQRTELKPVPALLGPSQCVSL